MFYRPCPILDSHTPHEYVKHWRLKDLPTLPNPEAYPEEWDVTYRCKGFKEPGKTWAESLGIEVPADAPGGQPLVGGPYRSKGDRQNINEIDYEGFFDTDAFRRSQ